MEAHHEGKEKKKGGLKEFFTLGEVGGYFFRKKDPSRKTNFNLRAMHTINKVSILMFLAAMIYFIITHI